jgi:curved DNA-binding protein CbpA
VVEAYRVLSDPRRRPEYDEVLARGQLRLGAGVKVKPRAEEALSDANARKFYQLAQGAMADGNGRSAAMYLKIALSSEPDNPILRDALARAEEMQRGGGRT